MIASRALVLALAAGCGAGGPRAVTAEPVDGPAIEEAAGLALLAIPRPTPGRAWVSMWIDAGARDATPPQLAVVAAWAAAPPEVDARALPDGIELSRECPTDELEPCLASLARALGTREVGDAPLASALARASDARRRAAADEARLADALALDALLGRGADPLGVAEPEGEIDRPALEGFLADHFGPGRALLVAVGDVSSSTLRRAAERTFRDLPAARAARAARAAPGRAVSVRAGGTDVVSVATTFDSPRGAIAAAHRFVARVDRASADVFPVRGAIALVGRAPRADATELIDRITELHEEAVSEAVVPIPEDPRAHARWLGARWIAGAAAGGGGLGVGAVVDGGRADRLVDDPDAALELQARARILASLEPTPGSEEDADLAHARLALPNGVHIAGERLEGADHVAATVLFEGGASEESARTHGVTALLASASVHACRSRAARELGAPPEALGIVIAPRIGAERFGWTVTGPRERWPEVTYLAARCARSRALDAAAVDRARLDAVAPAERAALALALAPDAPGRIVPAPADGVAAGLDDVRRWRARVAVGARAHIGLVGDVPLAAATARLARIAARYPRGEAPPAERWGGPPGTLGTGRSGPRVGAWIVWAAPMTGRRARAVAGFCERAERTLSAGGRLRVVERHHVFSGGWGLAAVRVEALEADLARLPALVPPIPAAPAPAGSPPRGSTPTSRSLALARGEADTDGADGASELAAATPRFVVLRPAR